MIQFSQQTAFMTLKPLIIFIAGIVLYTIIVYNLYRFAAKRDIFDLNLKQYNKFEHPVLYKASATILYIIEYLFFFPLFLLFWFILFSAILIAISKTNNIETIFLISVGIVSSIRIASYYKQPLARDIAKLLPFTLLAVFLIDSSYFSWNKSFLLLQQVPYMAGSLMYYFIFAIGLEFFLRIMFTITTTLKEVDDKKVKIKK